MGGNQAEYDIAIIGTGPAGISAAINARIRNKSFILFGNADLSAKIERSHTISNYPALPEISGSELNRKFAAHLEQMDIEITCERITGVYNIGKYFMLLAGQKEYKADAVILATGAQTVNEIKGERELLGKGVSYCATCDGNFYKGKTISAITRRAKKKWIFWRSLQRRFISVRHIRRIIREKMLADYPALSKA